MVDGVAKTRPAMGTARAVQFDRGGKLDKVPEGGGRQRGKVSGLVVPVKWREAEKGQNKRRKEET